MRLMCRFEFSASHQLTRHPGACRHLHGHNYTFEVVLQGPVDAETGMVMDFAELEAVVKSHALEQLDHTHLNDLLEIPSAEHIAQWIWRHLAPQLPGLVEVTLYELPTCAVTYRGEHE